jgi:hypothetical protein
VLCSLVYTLVECSITSSNRGHTLKRFKQLNETKISLQYHNTLNPSLWDGEQLKPDVRERLLQFGNMFANYAWIPRNAIKDIIMTGGNANYNYTSKSDIDVHVVVNKDSLGINREWLENFFKDKKTLWSIKHGFKIHGFPIELYVQDEIDPIPPGQGVYSLLRGSWNQMPTHQEINFNDPFLKKKVMAYVHQIDAMIKDHADISAFKELRSKLKNMRGTAIAAGGEFSLENLVFKELRNRGYLDKINSHMKKQKDKELSI